jgi:hypothetical protein
MRRGVGLRRRTALRPGGPLVRRTELKRKTGLKSRAIKASRPVMSPEEKAAKDIVEARSAWVCEIQVAGVCTGRAKDFCHRIREGQGGPWSAVNGLHGCRACHEWTHRNPAAARAKRWALKTFDSLTLPVQRRGVWVLLGEDGSVTPSRNGAAG